MEVTCDCERWEKSFPQIQSAQLMAFYHGIVYSGEVFEFCPWCGRKTHRKDHEGEEG